MTTTKEKELKLFQVQLGDCLDLMKDIESKSINMILADLPYGKTKNGWDAILIPFEPLWKEYERIITDNGVIALFGDEPFASRLRLSNEKLYRYDWVWIKSNATGFLNANKMPMKNTETISIFYKHLPIYHPQMRTGKPYVTKNKGSSNNYGAYETNFKTVNHGTRYPLKTIKFNSVKRTIHPTQKPVDLLEYLIRTYTDKGMTVLDNVMGSGSTGIACYNTGRNFIGMEKDPEYFLSAEERIANHVKQLSLLK